MSHKKINKEDPIILLGAGLSGSLMAVYLARRGFKVEIYERRPDMRNAETSAGRSINLAISERGLFACQEVGLLKEVMDICIPMRGRMIHDKAGQTQLQYYSKDQKTAINSISRGDLNMILMNAADEYDNIKFFFNQRCMGIDLKTGLVNMQNETNLDTYQVTGQTVLATDGAYSGIRYSMMKKPRFNFSQDYLTHCYKELSFPPASQGGWLVEKNALHIWPRGHFMLIALPNMDGSFTVTLFYPHAGPESFASLNSVEKAENFFAEEFPDALELMPDLATEFFENPTGDLMTVKCSPWYHRDVAVLLGDAAHAVVPFFGQGMNAAFEDCTVLNACLDTPGGDWESVFAAYNAERVVNGQAIADMALDNYIEMRDRVDDPDWKLQKEIEHKLEKEFSGRYISRYEMVSFTRQPYAEAMRRGELNTEILKELSAGISSIEELDLALAEKLINKYYS